MTAAKTKMARLVVDGLGLGESPRWHDGRLYLSDWVKRQIIAIDGAGKVEIIARVDAMPFSFAFLPDGRMALLAGTQLSIRRVDGSFAAHADLSALSQKPWNEIVVDGRGWAFVNTIGFDFPGGEFRAGILASVAADGVARIVADDVAFPNGMAVSSDNHTLVLAESYANRLTAFTIDSTGQLTDRRSFADLPGHYPDGITMDAEGAVWFADVPGRNCTRVAEGGAILDRVTVDRGCFACMLGGAAGTTLYIVAANWNGPDAIGNTAPSGQVLAVAVDVPRAGWP